MFDSLAWKTLAWKTKWHRAAPLSGDRDASSRLRALAVARGVPPVVPGRVVPDDGKEMRSEDVQEEWIDESEPSPAPAGPRLRGVRLPVVATAVVVVAACTVVGLLVARPDREVAPPLPAAAVTSAERVAGKLVVSVVGKVAKPGLVTLPEGARVADAVRAAGGASDVDSIGLNLARKLADGEQVYVGVPAPAELGPVGAQGKPAKVDLNGATVAQLDDLPGVGAVTAQRIADWRAEHGPFTAVEQLRQVDGIGDSRYARLKDLVVVR